MAEMGARPACIPTRDWRRVATSFSSERLLALDALLDACTLAAPPAAGDGGDSGDTATGGWGGRGDAWVLPLGDGDAATPNSWRSLGVGAGSAGVGAGAGEPGAQEVATKLVRAVLDTADDAVQDGYALELLQCLARLVPDAVLSDARAAFPRVGNGALREETVDEALLLEVLAGSWAVAGQFLQEGRVKGHYTGGDWPQLSRSIMVAFLRTAFHPRLWAARAAHSGALKARWEACWKDCRESARFVKLFATYSCVMWRRFPESLLFYAHGVAELAMYGLREVSDSVADMPIEANPLSAGAHAGGIWEGGAGSRGQQGAVSEQEARDDLECDRLNLLLEGRETYVRILVLLTLTHVHSDALASTREDGAEVVGRAVVDEVMVRIAEELVQASEHPDLKTVTYLPFSATHRIKIRLWQAVAIISALLPPAPAPAPDTPPAGGSTPKGDALQARMETLVAAIFRAMREDERKSVRFYLEIAAFQLVQRHAARIRAHLFALLADFDLQIPVAASGLLISNFLFRSRLPVAPPAPAGPEGAEGASPEETAAREGGSGAGDMGEAEAEAMRELAVAVLPWFSHHTHHVRSLASLALKYYCAHEPASRGRASGAGGGGGGELLTAAALTFMSCNEEVARLHAHLEKLFFSSLDYRSLCTHSQVFVSVYLSLSLSICLCPPLPFTLAIPACASSRRGIIPRAPF